MPSAWPLCVWVFDDSERSSPKRILEGINTFSFLFSSVLFLHTHSSASPTFPNANSRYILALHLDLYSNYARIYVKVDKTFIPIQFLLETEIPLRTNKKPHPQFTINKNSTIVHSNCTEIRSRPVS